MSDSILRTIKKSPDYFRALFLSKRPFAHTNRLNPIAQVIRQHGEAVGGVIVDIFHRKAEAGQLIHGLTVIVILAVIGTEIIAPDSREVLLQKQPHHAPKRQLLPPPLRLLVDIILIKP